jgi:uncharacterized protein YjeT (DUF2065 family)
LFACFVAVLVTWKSFASVERELRRGVLILLETHIEMSLLILRLILILVLRLTCFMDITIAHMILVHERTTLCLDTLVMTHVLIMVVISRVGMVFLLEGLTLTLSPDTWMILVSSVMVLVPLVKRGGGVPKVVKTMKTSSSRMVKCWISKIYLTNPSTKPSIFSCPM